MPGKIADLALESSTSFKVMSIMLLLLLPTPCGFHMTLNVGLNIIYGVQKTTLSPMDSLCIHSNKNKHKILDFKNQSTL